MTDPLLPALAGVLTDYTDTPQLAARAVLDAATSHGRMLPVLGDTTVTATDAGCPTVVYDQLAAGVS